MDKKLLGPVEIGLIVGIVVLVLSGVVYAGLAGFASIPGIPPILAKKEPTPSPSGGSTQLAPHPSPSPSLLAGNVPDNTGAATGTIPGGTVVTPSPLASAPVVTPSSAAPSTAPATTSPTAAPSAAGVSEGAQHDQRRKDDLATIQVALEQYKKNTGQYPPSPTFTDSKTFLASSPLVALIPTYMQSLPVDPLNPIRWYGYKSPDGKSYSLTASLENLSDPEGKFEGDIYLYTLRNQ